MKTRHVLLRPALAVGAWRQGLVLDWRRVPGLGASPPMWEAQVVSTDGRTTRVDWVPAVYLVPVDSLGNAEAPRHPGG